MKITVNGNLVLLCRPFTSTNSQSIFGLDIPLDKITEELDKADEMNSPKFSCEIEIVLKKGSTLYGCPLIVRTEE